MALIDNIISKITSDLKPKKVEQGTLNVIKNELFPLAYHQANLEGQVKVYKEDNARLKQEIDVLRALNARNDVESVEALRQSRLEGQIDILKEENERLRQELAIAKDPDAKRKIDALEKEIKDLKDENAKLRNSETRPAPPTFAAVLSAERNAQSSTQRKIVEVKAKQAPTLFIKPTNNQTTKEVRETLTKNINPRQDKLKITSIRTTPSVVIVQTETQVDCQKIAQKASQLSNIMCEEPRKRSPLLQVYAVPTIVPVEDFLADLYDLNLSEKLTHQEFQNEVKFRFKTGAKGKSTSNIVIETSPRVRANLIKQEKVYISFHALRVKDFVNVQKCFNCCDLGHPTKYCPETQPVCNNCGEKGHKRADCRTKECTVGCIPCKLRKRTCNNGGGSDCPTYKQLYARQIERTDFGTDNYW